MQAQKLTIAVIRGVILEDNHLHNFDAMLVTSLISARYIGIVDIFRKFC
jgi:hypothetical protein